jgi:class 3 adenylate cyclase
MIMGTSKDAGENVRVSCIGILNAVYYFNKELLVPMEKILDGLPFGMDFIKNTANWIDNKDAFRFYSNCKNAVKGFIHTDWKTVGENMFTNEAAGYFRLLFRLLPFKVIYANIPKYVLSVSKWGACETISLREGEAIYMLGAQEPRLRDEYSMGGECFHYLGVINSIPKVKSEFNYMGDAKHEICSMPMHVIMKNSYGLLPNEFSYDKQGFKIKGRLAATWIKLKTRRDNPKFLSRDYDFAVREDADALGVIGDILHNGVKIFKEGDIYNAPYCILKFTYKKRFYIGERLNNKKMILFLEKQLQMTEDKFRQAIWAKKEMEESMQEITKRDDIIKSYMRYSILDEIYSGGNPLEFKPVKKSAAIMFADIRNFTALTEEMDPLALVEFLNEYIDKINGIIMKNSGEIDKLMGDGIMALFADCEDAVRASVEMNSLLKSDSFKMMPGSDKKLKIGIGLNYDEIVEGNIGTAGSRMERTIIGDGVNLASRLESLTKYYSSSVLVSASVNGEVRSGFTLRYLDLITVKGKSQPIAIFEVLDAQDAATKVFKTATMSEYMKGTSAYLAGNFKEAMKIFKKLDDRLEEERKKSPECGDTMLKIYLQRLKELVKSADDKKFMKEWDGVYRHEDK